MRVTDIHVHIQPWWQLKPEALAFIQAGHRHDAERIKGFLHDPKAFLAYMDEQGIHRCGLVNYPAPDTLGFTDETNDFVSKYVRDHPDRLLAYGGVHPRLGDPRGAPKEVKALHEKGIRALKIHPPHHLVHANDHVRGNERLGAIYATAQELGMPVMVHTGTSMFPGARNRFGNPLDLDDVLVDFPDLKVVMAHGGRPLWTREAFFLLRRFPEQLWLDVSSIPPRRMAEWFPRIDELYTQLLYGSDWPGPGPKELGDNVKAYRQLELPRPFFEAMFEDNAARLFPEVPT
ncbi:MAG TPA: amidohydrolase family protein [Candidatus Thermoplasmatota archaeon]|nr:amidohydrolase family protein [Candidatus Thermoplasmatota archaeon]